ncbi:hypothetical protein GH714_022514 [Hevea brasiliensis]|uniref:Golgin candidate 2 n=1 Tax=Hevea brasiliensis TaxID=3981 RepID=A0A6A6MV93_HEVBR|nr:hypothetical protein GH714_022514 [Hevea brasiliensis]
MKDQLKNKTAHETNNGNSHKYFGKSSTDPNVKNLSDFSNVSSNSNGGGKEIANAPKSSPKPRPTLTDSDWTELLSSPTQATPSSSSNCRNEVSAIRGLRKYGGRKQGSSGSTLSVLEGKMNLKSSGGVKSKKRFDISFGTRLNVKPSDEEESTSSARSSSIDLQSDGKILDRGELDHKDIGANQQRNQGNEKNGKLFESKDMSEGNLLPVGIKSHSLEMPSVSERVGGVSDVKKGMSNVYDRLRSTVRGKHRSGAASRSSASDDLKKGFSTSDEGSDSDSDSVSTSDSENEQEREMREKILAEKAAAKAVEAIKEGEYGCQIGRRETELGENTRRTSKAASRGDLITLLLDSALSARSMSLQTANADLARSLATAQKNLEMEAKKLEANIEMTRKDLEEPTEVEIEVKRRLAQLTDHLIQKQAQVEALSSEKATLLFRIEAVSRLLDENRSISKDMESGTWEIPNSKSGPLLEDKIRLGSAHLGSLLQQLDAIFAASAVFVRRNPTAKLWSLVYLVCLHFWVIYILFTHSQASNEGRSGAIISLENINNTADV